MVVPSHETIGPTEAITLSVWVNAASWADAPRIVQKGEDDTQYSLRAENNKLRFVLRLAAVTTLETALPPTGKWVHLGGHVRPAEMRLYQDGSRWKRCRPPAPSPSRSPPCTSARARSRPRTRTSSPA